MRSTVSVCSGVPAAALDSLRDSAASPDGMPPVLSRSPAWPQVAHPPRGIPEVLVQQEESPRDREEQISKLTKAEIRKGIKPCQRGRDPNTETRAARVTKDAQDHAKNRNACD